VGPNNFVDGHFQDIRRCESGRRRDMAEVQLRKNLIIIQESLAG
jgi:hypothetical protein